MDSKNPRAQSNSNLPSTSSGGPATKCPFDNLVVLKFTATIGGYYYDHPHEVIQMAATVLYGPGPDWTVKPETDFSDFVRPSRHPILPDFCKDVTGITQDEIDKADEFPKVFEKFEKWLETTGIAKSNFAIVTEGRADIWKFAQYQFILCNMPLPIYLKRFISAFELYHGIPDKAPKDVKQIEVKEKYKDKEPTADEKQALDNPIVNDPHLYRDNQEMNSDHSYHSYHSDHSDQEDQEDFNEEVMRVDPNDPGLDPFRRGRAEADRRDQERLAEANRLEQERLAQAVHPEQEGVYSPPNTEGSAESDEYDRLAAVEQPRARKRGSEESIDMGESSGLHEIPSKKLKVGANPFVQYMCKFYNIQRTGKRYNAADDAATLRDVIYEMLKVNKIDFYFNCMLVCLDDSREGTWKYLASPGWRRDFFLTLKMYEKVLPLFCRLIKIEENVDYARCITCEIPLEECGSDWVHKQFPLYLSNPIFGEIGFALEAGLNIDKSKVLVLDDVEEDSTDNVESSDSAKEDSDVDEKKNL